MPTNRKRRSRLATGRISEDQEMHVCDSWCVDPCIPWYGKPGFPFRSDEHRREVWEANRAHLMARYPGCDLAAAGDYDGAEVDPERFPNVWGRLSGGIPGPTLADVVHLGETERHDGDE